MSHKSFLSIATIAAAAALLSGCATTPNMHYVGAQAQPNVQHKNVALVTTVAGEQYDTSRNRCFFADSHKCKEDTFSGEELVKNYNALVFSALSQSGARATVASSIPASGWAVKTDISAMPHKKYAVMLYYDLGKTLGMGLIPIVGLFTPHYYTIHVHLLDAISIYHDGHVVWKKSTQVNEKKDISGSRFVIGGAHSEDAYRIYRKDQTKPVTNMMLQLNEVMAKEGGN